MSEPRIVGGVKATKLNLEEETLQRGRSTLKRKSVLLVGGDSCARGSRDVELGSF